ncbi:MAG: hypothetical protein IJT13_01300, partial [Bacteroidaceae bacterium]|nr:hypothetical protein [Bacteroidaceae bacterium]
MDEVGMPSLYVDIANPRHTCSQCGKKLEVKRWLSDKKDAESNYRFGVITTCEDFQVVRVFNIHQWNTMGSGTYKHVCEVFNIWLDIAKGKEVIVTKPFSRGYNFFRWRIMEPMKIGRHNGGCGGYYIYEDLYDLHGLQVYPR